MAEMLGGMDYAGWRQAGLGGMGCMRARLPKQFARDAPTGLGRKGQGWMCVQPNIIKVFKVIYTDLALPRTKSATHVHNYLSHPSPYLDNALVAAVRKKE